MIELAEALFFRCYSASRAGKAGTLGSHRSTVSASRRSTGVRLVVMEGTSVL